MPTLIYYEWREIPHEIRILYSKIMQYHSRNKLEETVR